jgi:hypothetical protein
VERLAVTLGLTKLSKSQVSLMARSWIQMVAHFRNRPLQTGPYTSRTTNGPSPVATWAWRSSLPAKRVDTETVINDANGIIDTIAA